MRKNLLFCATFLFITNSAAAIDFGGFSGGGQGCGSCEDIARSLLADEPAFVQSRALDIYQSLLSEKPSNLVVLEAFDTEICNHFDCRELGPSVVQRMVKSARENVRQESESSWQRWNYGISAFNAFLSLAALVISFIAYRTSHK